MSDFALFEEALTVYNQNVINEIKEQSDDEIDNNSDIEKIIEQSKTFISNEEEKCCHTDIVTEGGIITCLECGEELKKVINHDKEWRYYSNNDGKRTNDPNRVQIRKCEDKSIFKDVENMGFSEKIVNKANEIYMEVTKGQIYRGNSRKAIVFACIFHSYKINGNPQSHEHLLNLFNLKKRGALKGIKHVNINAPKESDVHRSNITPTVLINDIMDRFKATVAQKAEVEKLYGRIKNRSSKLNRARPQSVSSGVVYYWIKLKGIDISLKEFAKKTELSELTINKIAKEISAVLNTPHVL